MAATSNITSLSGPFPKDFVMAFPRMIARAGSFAFFTVPERIDSMLGLRNGGSTTAEATGNRTWNMVSNALSSDAVSRSAVPTDTATAAVENVWRGSNPLSIIFAKNFGGIFSYMMSKWALACFTLAIVLNRTQIYSAGRRHISISWPLRLALRIVPIVLFLHHISSLLQAMRCQTSPEFSHLRYGKADKHVDLDFAGEGGMLYYLSSVLLFWENDADSCLAVDLIPSRSESWDRKGSFSLLWPLFRSLCLGQFVETISCAVQGRPLMTETGMSIFEHSLAFAESEASISNRLGLSWLGSSKANPATKSSSGSEDTVVKLFTRSEILDKMNTPPEVLLMGLISSLNNLSSQILGVFNTQSRYRLLNTGIWGLCFMSAFIWGFLGMLPDSGPEAMIFRFPTVCIVGFIPHLLILIGIIICGFIYSLALLLCFLSPPSDGPPPQSLSDRFRLARENMQANGQLANIRFDMHEDFYTALLKIGFSILTVASEAVYLSEGQKITVAQLTWLEEDRIKEVEAFDKSNDPSRRLGVHLDSPRVGERSEVGAAKPWKSGYDKPTSVKAVKSPRIVDSRVGADGVGHLQRGGRYLMAAQFFRGIFWLWVNWLKLITNATLDRAGVTWRPQWLRRAKRDDVAHDGSNISDQGSAAKSLDFWILSDDGTLQLPENDDVDVAYEMRKRQQNESETWSAKEERAFDSRTYDWWKSGGWWGEKDESGSYLPSPQDDDTTSVLSIATNSTSASSTDNDDSGANTPTQRHPYSYARSPSSTPSLDHTDTALDPSHLARLLDPKEKETRNEAHMLAHHLSAPGITTRSKYRHALSSANTKLLTSTRYRPSPSSSSTTNPTIPPTGPLSPEEESQLLEHLILSRRSRALSADQSHHRQQGGGTGSDTWRDGAAGMGPGGPQCVVCQSAPRTILAWPCRCLSLCEECRVSLAMNNFGTCVCCRQDVVGFSRLFVP